MFETAMFLELMEKLCKKSHEMMKGKGFWDDGMNFGEKIALMHSELSEALEAHRSGNPPCPKSYVGHGGVEVKLDMSCLEEEFADLVLRLTDLCGYMGIDLGRAILAKMEYNSTRPHKHNKAY